MKGEGWEVAEGEKTPPGTHLFTTVLVNEDTGGLTDLSLTLQYF